MISSLWKILALSQFMAEIKWRCCQLFLCLWYTTGKIICNDSCYSCIFFFFLGLCPGGRQDGPRPEGMPQAVKVFVRVPTLWGITGDKADQLDPGPSVWFPAATGSNLGSQMDSTGHQLARQEKLSPLWQRRIEALSSPLANSGEAY